MDNAIKEINWLILTLEQANELAFKQIKQCQGFIDKELRIQSEYQSRVDENLFKIEELKRAIDLLSSFTPA